MIFQVMFGCGYAALWFSLAPCDLTRYHTDRKALFLVERHRGDRDPQVGKDPRDQKDRKNQQ